MGTRKTRVAINGFGRIGRLAFRLLFEKLDEVELVAINDIVPSDNLAYLLQYDSTHGRWPHPVHAEPDRLHVGNQSVRVFMEKDPLKLPWKELAVDWVVESSGKFNSLEGAQLHVDAGAARVLITAPASGDMPTLVFGVNEADFDPSAHFIISNASCTTNCLAVLTKVLLDAFGIEEGLMTTIHALTASQPTVDGPSKKDWRGGRAAGQNIIPASTGAAKAVALCLPEVKGKLTGMAFRVPVADVSAVDLTVRLKQSTSYDAICAAMQQAATGKMRGILAYNEEQLVSSDYIGSRYSAIFDRLAGIALNDRFYKLVAWYDNEMGYSARVVDLLLYMAKRSVQ